MDEVTATIGLHGAELYQRLQELSAQSASMEDVFDKLFTEENDAYRLLRARLAAYEGADIQDLSSVYVETLYHMIQGGVAAVHPADNEERRI